MLPNVPCYLCLFLLYVSRSLPDTHYVLTISEFYLVRFNYRSQYLFSQLYPRGIC